MFFVEVTVFTICQMSDYANICTDSADRCKRTGAFVKVDFFFSSDFLFLFFLIPQLWSQTMFKQTLKNFSIHFNALNEKNTVSSGDVITGHISFDLTKLTKITSITMELKGKAHVHWSAGSGGKRKRRRHFSAKLEFFKLKSVILQEHGGMCSPLKY